MEENRMPNGYEFIKEQTENIERMIFIEHLKSILSGEENAEDVLRQYEAMTPAYKPVRKSQS